MFQTTQNNQVVLNEIFSSIRNETAALRVALEEKTPATSSEGYDPKKAFMLGANQMVPLIDELTNLEGVLLVTDLAKYEVLYTSNELNDVYIVKHVLGEKKVMATYSLVFKEYSGCMEAQELTNLSGLILLLGMLMK